MKLLKVMIFIAVIGLCFQTVLFAQECGPNCPICSGSGSNTGTLLASGVILGNVLVVPDGEETMIPTVKFAVHKRLDIGLGYLNKSEKALWNARFLIHEEKEKLPGVIAGTGSVRIGGDDQSAFVALTKNFEDNIGVPFRLTVGAASLLSEFEKGYFIGTISYLYKEKLFPFISYDGQNENYGISYILMERINIGLLYLENEYFAMTTGFRFTFN